MAEYKDREHFIPLRKSDLIELLCADKQLSFEEREPFRQFCRLVSSVFHFEYLQQLEEKQKARFFYGVRESELRRYFDRAAHHRRMNAHGVDIDVTAGQRGRVAADARTLAEAAGQQDAAHRQRRHHDLELGVFVECAALQHRYQRGAVDGAARETNADLTGA